MIVWGCHRDTVELSVMGFPVFSYGPCPVGPLQGAQQEAEALSTAKFGTIVVEPRDIVFADDDGVIFAPGQGIEQLLQTAMEIKETERRQVEKTKAGETLHSQLQFEAYLAKRQDDRTYSFRQHLRELGGAIEE
jgi:regulator of RNase E activity RraA